MKKDIFDKLNLMFNKLRWNGVSLIGFLIAFVLAFFDVPVWSFVVCLFPLSVTILYIIIRSLFKKY